MKKYAVFCLLCACKMIFPARFSSGSAGSPIVIPFRPSRPDMTDAVQKRRDELANKNRLSQRVFIENSLIQKPIKQNLFIQKGKDASIAVVKAVKHGVKVVKKALGIQSYTDSNGMLSSDKENTIKENLKKINKDTANIIQDEIDAIVKNDNQNLRTYP